VAVAAVTAAGERVTWDVSAELDTAAERSSFAGWAVRDRTAAETGLESSEGAAANAPGLRLVYTAREPASCVDADPESATARSRDLHVVTATVTDGSKVATATGGDDGCNGSPVAARVLWTVEDDTPDVYVATVDGTPTQRTSGSGGAAGPDAASATAGASGRTSAGLRLAGAETADPNRVSARIDGSADAMEPGADPRCGLPPPAGLDCTGENATEDDAAVTWSAAATPVASPSSSTSDPASPPASPSTSASSAPPPSSPSSSPSSTAPGAEREVTLSSSAARVDAGRNVTLSGRLTTSDPRCRVAGVTILVRRRVFGTKRYGSFGETSTDASGQFELTRPVESSADMTAVVRAYEGCAAAMSSAVPVEARGRVSSRTDVDRRAGRLTVSGAVKPRHRGGTVVLQWVRRGRRPARMARTRLRRSSTFHLTVAIDWTGTRTLRVTWASPHADHADGVGKSFRVKGA
jgi:hypothetical protein